MSTRGMIIERSYLSHLFNNTTEETSFIIVGICLYDSIKEKNRTLAGESGFSRRKERRDKA
jgi:hypothetical protein